MTDDDVSVEDMERYRINSETARISWLELQRHFAAGRLVLVKDSLDLIDVAYQFSIDNSAQAATWVATDSVAAVTDDLAQSFLDESANFWAVVVKPWVLIQRTTDASETPY